MLKVFRTKGVARKVLWVVLGIIIISFGFGFGMSQFSGSDQTKSSAGKIFGKNVTFTDFQAYARAARIQAILMTGNEYEKMLPLIDMENETWTRIMLVKEAERRGVKASNNEVVSFIRTMPAFQRDGQFDKKLYNNILNHVFRSSARDFEESIRDQIRITKLLQSSVGKTVISDEDVRREYERRNRKIKAGYVVIDPAQFNKTVKISDEEVKNYFNEHRGDFLVPETIKLQYVTIPVSEKAKDDDLAKAEAAAQQVYQQALTGSLQAAAKTQKLSVVETGFVSLDNPDLSLGWPLEFWQQALEDKSGAVLSPVKTSKGYVIARVSDRKVAYIPEFAKAKDDVKARLLADRTSTIAKDKAETLHQTIATRIAAKTTPAVAAQGLGLTVKETPYFSAGEYLPEIGISEDFQSAAMSLNQSNLLGPVVMTSRGPVILWWESEESLDEKKYEQEKEEFAQTYRREETNRAINSVIQEIRQRAKLESHLNRTAAK